MADVYTRIGYIKGDQGATGAQGEKGDTGDAATIQVGSVTTVPYGQTANVVNSGTEQAAVFDFTIPQGRPGQQVTEMDNLLLNSITTSAAEFPLPAVGETGKVLWGKVVKWFSDMVALVATKLNSSNVVNNLTTTASGYALDARQGKALRDSIQLTNVTESFAMKSGTDNFVQAYYQSGMNAVHGAMSMYLASGTLSTAAPICNISAPYRPSGLRRCAAMIKLMSGDWYPYYIEISSAGVVTQKLTSTCVAVFSNFEYII